MPAVFHRATRQAKGLGFRDKRLNQFPHLNLPEAGLTIADDQRRRFSFDFEIDFAEQPAGLEQVEVFGHADDSVRLVSAQVGIDKAFGDEVAFGLRDSGRVECGGDQLPKLRCFDLR